MTPTFDLAHSIALNRPIRAMPVYRSFALLVIASLLLFLGAGCDSGLTDMDSDDPDGAVPLTAELLESDEIELDVIEEGDMRSGTFSGIQEGDERVIRDADEFDTLWSELHAHVTNPPSTPDVNFEEEVVFAIMLGQRPTAGYGIEIDDVLYNPDDDVIEVFYAELEPREAAATVITSPFLIASVEAPNLDAEFEFNKADETREHSS